MPVERNVDGSYTTGLRVTDVPASYSKKGAGLSRLTKGFGKMPVNPLLAEIASRKVFTDPATGQIVDRQPTNVVMLYRPGGLLYNPDAALRQP